jgi:hypothetical protein
VHVKWTFCFNASDGSVAKIILLHFDTIIFTLMCHCLFNEND